MSVDVVCAGTPFLDLIFRGLPRLPKLGEEVLASEVVIVPGAMANVAHGLRQLGLDAVVCAPVGTDPAGRLLRELMEDAGVHWIGAPAPATPISVGLPLDGDRAFVTVAPEVTLDVATIVALGARAVVVDLPVALTIPPGPRVFAVLGDPEVAALVDQPPLSVASLRALITNEREACHLTGDPNAETAAARLAARGCPTIVTRGAAGAIAALPDGRILLAPTIASDPDDTVGAGDLVTAAFVWADLLGRSVEESLEVATAYASLSLARPSPRQKGLTKSAFVEALVVTGMGALSWVREV